MKGSNVKRNVLTRFRVLWALRCAHWLDNLVFTSYACVCTTPRLRSVNKNWTQWTPTNIRIFCSFCCSASTTFVYLANQPHTPLLAHKYGFRCYGNVFINYTGHLLWTTCSYHKGQLHVSDSIFPLLKVKIVVKFPAENHDTVIMKLRPSLNWFLDLRVVQPPCNGNVLHVPSQVAEYIPFLYGVGKTPFNKWWVQWKPTGLALREQRCLVPAYL